MKAPVQVLAVIDANSSGVSGDKYLGALVNMGGRVERLRKVARVVAEYLPGTSRMDVEARGTPACSVPWPGPQSHRSKHRPMQPPRPRRMYPAVSSVRRWDRPRPGS